MWDFARLFILVAASLTFTIHIYTYIVIHTQAGAHSHPYARERKGLYLFFCKSVHSNVAEVSGIHFLWNLANVKIAQNGSNAPQGRVCKVHQIFHLAHFISQTSNVENKI